MELNLKPAKVIFDAELTARDSIKIIVIVDGKQFVVEKLLSAQEARFLRKSKN